MEQHTRTARIESIDESGVFTATLATEGEASDGDILSIKGGQIPERMPMLLSHWNDPTAVAGSVTDPKKELGAKPPRLRVTGRIEMGGVGTLAEIRRDVAFMMGKHGGAMSVRWDEVEGGKQPIRRVNLPSDHAYFVDADTATGAKRWGYFWPEWRAVEGSIVALGADPGATVDGRLYATRADETEGEVSAFWRAMAQDAEAQRDASKAAASLANLRVETNACIEAGVAPTDIANAVAGAGVTDEIGNFRRCEIGGESFFLPASAADQLAEERAVRELAPTSVEIATEPEPTKPEPDPTPDPEPVTPDTVSTPEAVADQRSPLEFHINEIATVSDLLALVGHIKKELADSRTRGRERLQYLLDHAKGKVD